MRWLATQCPDEKCELSSTHLERGSLVSIVYVGIDPAKNVFALHGVGAAGALQLRQPKLARSKLSESALQNSFEPGKSEPRDIG